MNKTLNKAREKKRKKGERERNRFKRRPGENWTDRTATRYWMTSLLHWDSNQFESSDRAAPSQRVNTLIKCAANCTLLTQFVESLEQIESKSYRDFQLGVNKPSRVKCGNICLQLSASETAIHSHHLWRRLASNRHNVTHNTDKRAREEEWWREWRAHFANMSSVQSINNYCDNKPFTYR